MSGPTDSNAPRPHTVVLVEGVSDSVALETLARRRGRCLADEGVQTVPMGGAMNARRFLIRYGPTGLRLRVTGLYDAAEEQHIRRGLEAAELGVDLSRDGIRALGFHRCDADLEDELIRALGTDVVEQVIAAQGQLPSLHLLRKQPALRERDARHQLRRFIAGRSGNKARYAELLVNALDLSRVPQPLDDLLADL